MVDWGLRYLQIAVLAVLALLASGTLVYAMPGDITFDRAADNTSGISAATFPHDTHELRYRCDACHSGLFKMKQGSTKITMELINQGKLCGSCHNDKIAFATDNCLRCHGGSKPGTLIFERAEGDASGMPAAIFPHGVHLANFKCDTCHDGLFKMSQGSTEISMERINRGELCGACHNDGVAFAAFNCMRCHTGGG